MKTLTVASSVLMMTLLGSSLASAADVEGHEKFSAFKGVETEKVSEVELKQVSGEYIWMVPIVAAAVTRVAIRAAAPYVYQYGVPAAAALASWATRPSTQKTVTDIYHRFN